MKSVSSRGLALYKLWVVPLVVLVQLITNLSYAQEANTEAPPVGANHVDADGVEEEAQAANLFEAAETAFRDKDYERAARLFSRADEKAPHASVLFNAAVSWDYAGDRAAAADAYETATAREGLTPNQTRQAEQRLAELGKLLGMVQIAKPVGDLVTVGRIQRQPIPVRFFQEPGSYQLQLQTAAGATTTTEIDVQPGEVLRLELSAGDAPVVTPTPTPAPKAQNDGLVALPPKLELPEVQTSVSTQEVFGWVAVGLGVVGAGFATYWGLQTERQQEAYFQSRLTNRSAYEQGLSLRTRTNVTWVASGLTAGTGLTLILTSPRFEF